MRGRLFTVTEQRLIRWGCTEPQARVLAHVLTLSRYTSDRDVEAAIVTALVDVKETTSRVGSKVKLHKLPPKPQVVTAFGEKLSNAFHGRK